MNVTMPTTCEVARLKKAYEQRKEWLSEKVAFLLTTMSARPHFDSISIGLTGDSTITCNDVELPLAVILVQTGLTGDVLHLYDETDTIFDETISIPLHAFSDVPYYYNTMVLAGLEYTKASKLLDTIHDKDSIHTVTDILVGVSKRVDIADADRCLSYTAIEIAALLNRFNHGSFTASYNDDTTRLSLSDKSHIDIKLNREVKLTFWGNTTLSSLLCDTHYVHHSLEETIRRATQLVWAIIELERQPIK